jgi:hypothetical protein
MGQFGTQRKYFYEIRCLSTSQKSVEKIHVLLKYDKKQAILHEDLSTFIITYRRVLLKWEMFWTKVVQKTKTYKLHSTTFFFKPRSFLDNVKNIVDPDRPKMQNNTTPEKMRFAYRITKARIETHTHISYLWLFHGNNGYANAPQCYVIRRLPILLYFTSGVTHNYKLTWNGQTRTLKTKLLNPRNTRMPVMLF